MIEYIKPTNLWYIKPTISTGPDYFFNGVYDWWLQLPWCQRASLTLPQSTRRSNKTQAVYWHVLTTAADNFFPAGDLHSLHLRRRILRYWCRPCARKGLQSAACLSGKSWGGKNSHSDEQSPQNGIGSKLPQIGVLKIVQNQKWWTCVGPFPILDPRQWVPSEK